MKHFVYAGQDSMYYPSNIKYGNVGSSVSMTSMGSDMPTISHRNSPDDTSLYGRSAYRSTQVSQCICPDG